MTISLFNLQYCHYYWFLTLLLSWLCFCFLQIKKRSKYYTTFWGCLWFWFNKKTEVLSCGLMDIEEIFDYSSCLISIHQLPPALAEGIGMNINWL